jgi:very-short-patch-repair endonuclease
MTISINYYNKSDDDKKLFLEIEYCQHYKSIDTIAKELGSYPKHIKSEMERLLIPFRTRSETQKLLLQHGKIPHPTLGKVRTEQEKLNISESMGNYWIGLSKEEIEQRSEAGKANYNSKTEEEKAEMHKLATKAILKAAKHGSKLEHYLHENLIKEGFKVDFHKEQFIIRERLQIDLFLPELNIAIEIDGPSHYEAVWGDKNFAQSSKSDDIKTGLILGKGLVFIRIKHQRVKSQKYLRDTFTRLKNTILQIKENFPEEGHRLIILGET